MQARRFAVLAVVIACLCGVLLAQDEELPPANWSAPPYWNPMVHPQAAGGPGGTMVATAQGIQANAEALPSSPLPFVAIAPCRIVDTRVPVSDGFHQPNFADDESRTFNLPASPNCTGLPSTAGAWSLNIQFRPLTQLAFLTAYPTGTTMPGVSTLTAGPAAWVQNVAIVPAGTGGAVDIYCQYAGRVVIDINGYYGPQSVVTSLNTKIGDVTLAPGSNVAITPSGNTLTIAMTGVPGGTLPAGTASQTLYSNGSVWLPSSVLTNDGAATVGVAGNLALPQTTSQASGVLMMGGSVVLHRYPPNEQNLFVGDWAGGAFAATAFNNTGVGTFALHDLTSGVGNTAVGVFAVPAITSGYNNSAVGIAALRYATAANRNSALGAMALMADTTGSDNTSLGYYSLKSNTTGAYNTAAGSESLENSTTATLNAAFGAYSLTGAVTGSWNTAVGAHSLEVADGDCNTAVGEFALKTATTGDFNTALGQNAGYLMTAGSYTTFLGAYAGTTNTHPDVSNAVAIGSFATVTQDNSMALGGIQGTAWALNVGIGTATPNDTLQVVGDVRVGTSGTNGCLKNFAGTALVGTCFSDARFKTDVRPFEPVLDRVARLQPVHFAWRVAEFPDYHFGAGTNSGLIAQDVEPLFPDMVATDEHGYKTVNYTELSYLTLAAVRELKAKADALEAENSDLRAELHRLAAAVAELQARTH